MLGGVKEEGRIVKKNDDGLQFDEFVVASFAVQDMGRYQSVEVVNPSSDNGKSFLLSEDEADEPAE